MGACPACPVVPKKPSIKCSSRANHNPREDRRAPWIFPEQQDLGASGKALVSSVTTRCLCPKTMGWGIGGRSAEPTPPWLPPHSESLPSCFADSTADASSSSCPFNRSPASEKQQRLSGEPTHGGPEPQPRAHKLSLLKHMCGLEEATWDQEIHRPFWDGDQAPPVPPWPNSSTLSSQ